MIAHRPLADPARAHLADGLRRFTRRLAAHGARLALLAVVFCAASGSVLGQELMAEWKATKNPVAKQGKNVTLQLTVTNGTLQPLTNLAPVDLAADGTGNAEWWRWPKPSFADLAPGESQTFKITFRAQLAGFVTFSGRAQGYDPVGNAVLSEPDETETFFVQPGKFGNTSATGSFGFAAVKAGKLKLPVRFVDEDSGGGIAGLSVAIVKLKKEKGRFMLLVTDAFERYPTQLLQLRGIAALPPGDGIADEVDFVDVPLASGPGPMRAGPMRTVETSLLPAVEPPSAVDTREADAVIKAIQQLAKAKLPKPPELEGQKAKVVKPKIVVAAAEGLDALRDLIAEINAPEPGDGSVPGAFIATGIEQFPNSLGSALGDVAIVDLADPLIPGAAGWVYPDDEFLDLALTRVDWGPYSFVVAGTRVAKGFDKTSMPADPPLAETVLVSATDAADGDTGIPDVELAGVFEASSDDVLGLARSAPLDESGQALVDLATASYQTAVHRPGFDAAAASLDLTPDDGGGDGVFIPLDIAQTARAICSGVVSVEEQVLTRLLDAGDQFTATATFFDCTGAVVAVKDVPLWTLSSGPKGEIASVDGAGLVTIDKGCGAGYVTAWYDGIQCTGWQFDTSCNGSLPPLPPPPKNNELSDDDLNGSWIGSYTLDYVIDNIFCNPQAQMFNQAGAMSMSLGASSAPSGDFDVVFGSFSMSNMSTIAGPPECVSSTTSTREGSVSSGRLEKGVFTGDLALKDLTVSFSVTGDDDQLDGTWTAPGSAGGSFTLTRGPFGD